MIYQAKDHQEIRPRDDLVVENDFLGLFTQFGLTFGENRDRMM